jgi:hypothetical protein
MFDLKEIIGRKEEIRPGTEAAFPRASAELTIDNGRVLEWVHEWAVGEEGKPITYERDALQIITESGVLQYTFQTGVTLTEAYATGDARFISAGTVRAEKAISGSPKAVTIELK